MVLIGVKKDDTAGYAPGKALLFERSFFFISEKSDPDEKRLY